MKKPTKNAEEALNKFLEFINLEDETMKCNVCGHEFEPKAENRYEATKPVYHLIGGVITTMHDCFDCPECGCQIVAQERLDRIENLICCGTEQNTEPCD